MVIRLIGGLGNVVNGTDALVLHSIGPCYHHRLCVAPGHLNIVMIAANSNISSLIYNTCIISLYNVSIIYYTYNINRRTCFST